MPRNPYQAWNLVKNAPEDDPIRIYVQREMERDISTRLAAIEQQILQSPTENTEQLVSELNSLYIPPNSGLDTYNSFRTQFIERLTPKSADIPGTIDTTTVDPIAKITDTNADSPSGTTNQNPLTEKMSKPSTDTATAVTDKKIEKNDTKNKESALKEKHETEQALLTPSSSAPLILNLDQAADEHKRGSRGEAIEFFGRKPDLVSKTALPVTPFVHFFSSTTEKKGRHGVELHFVPPLDLRNRGTVQIDVLPIDARRRTALDITLVDETGATTNTTVAISIADGRQWQTTSSSVIDLSAINNSSIVTVRIQDVEQSSSPFFVSQVLSLRPLLPLKVQPFQHADLFLIDVRRHEKFKASCENDKRLKYLLTLMPSSIAAAIFPETANGPRMPISTLPKHPLNSPVSIKTSLSQIHGSKNNLLPT